MEVKRFCVCGYELVLKMYGEPNMGACFAHDISFPRKKELNSRCTEKWYCYECDKFVD